jgi:hypothetical protein
MLNLRWVAILIGLTILYGCSGSSNNMPAAPTPLTPVDVPALSVLGAPFDAAKVSTTECANPTDPAITGLASSARFPKSVGAFRVWPSSGANTPSDFQTPLQLRADQHGGFVVSHMTNLNGAMFQITADGSKS